MLVANSIHWKPVQDRKHKPFMREGAMDVFAFPMSLPGQLNTSNYLIFKLNNKVLE